jgi:phage tail sheath protein FI
MPQYLHPGVYIEEIERGPRPIEGVPTSVAAFLGLAERGPLMPRLVTSYKDYVRTFGAVYAQDKFLPYAASGFFENGGKQLYGCRLVGQNATPAWLDFGDFTIRASGPGAWGLRLWVNIQDSTTKDSSGAAIGFRISAGYFPAGQAPYDPFDKANSARLPRPQYTEDFDDLVTDESSPDYYGKRVPFIDLDKGELNQGPQSSSLFILVRKSGVAPNTQPARNTSLLTNDGADDETLTAPDYQGLPAGTRADIQGLTALELDAFRDVAIVYAPAAADDVNLDVITHCENMRYRFAVLDCPKGVSDPSQLDPRTNMPVDSSYAGFYYPWIAISDPSTGARKFIPPGGHVIGVYARTDDQRGVFKAPANENVNGVLDLEYDIRDNDQDTINPRGVNAIRRFPGRGIKIWGARTLTSDSLWRYVSVRRLFIFLERSIYEGTQWVVFEPNDPRLWARVVDSIRLFLRTQWREGALFGRKEEEAFFITCDETTMTQDDILNGRLICEIGIAPVRPAEFVIFRIFQNTAEAQT